MDEKICKKCGKAGDFYVSNPHRCKTCVKAAVSARRDPVEARRWQLKSRYDTTPDAVDAMSVAQGGLCALCGRPPRGTGRAGKRLNVDHDHKTGKVRKLLCVDCNRALGWMQDDPEMLEKAAAYIRSHREAA